MRALRSIPGEPHPSQRELLRIVIPAKNEAGRIARTVIECCEYFGASARVLVVLNGCTDDTAAVLHDLQARYDTLDVMEIPAPIGKGGAVRAGMTFGDEPFVAFADADGSAAARQIELLLERCCERDVAGAIGSRWIEGATIGRKQPLRRRIASRAFNLAVRALFGLRFSDTQCGAKVFRRDAIEAIFQDLEIANFAFDVDVLFALRRAGRRVVEVPIVWDDAPDESKVRLLRSGTSMLAALVRLRVKHSPLRLIPFADRLARASTMPVRDGLELLVLTDAATASVVPEDALAVLRDLERSGHRITIRELRGALSVPALYFWYIRYAQRRFDVLVDASAGSATRLLRFSSKPKIAREALTRLSEVALREAFESMGRACGYNAFLSRSEREWVVSAYGRSQQRTVLRAALQP